MIDLLTERAFYQFLLGDAEGAARVNPGRMQRVWLGLLGASLVWGVGMAGLWHLAHLGFLNYLMTGLVVGLAILLWLYRRSALSLADLIAGPDASLRTLVLGSLVAAVVVSLSQLQPEYARFEYPFPEQMAWLSWLRPQSKADRVLVLMPLWGVWAMFAPVQFRRVLPGESPAVAALARRCGPLTVSALMGVLMLVSVGYFAFLPWTQLSIPGVAILTALVGGFALAARSGRLDRRVLLANNLLTQLAFLVAYLVNLNIRPPGW